MKRSKVLVIAPGRMTNGGITSVVEMYSSHTLWQKWQCKWIETHADGNKIYKTYIFIRSFCIFLSYLKNAELVHIHFSEPMSAFRKFFFQITSLLANKKVILHFHSFSPDTTLKGNFSFLYRWMFNRCHAIIAISDYWKLQISNCIQKDNSIYVVHNPAILRKVNLYRRNIILFAGTLSARKGYSDLLKGFKMIHHWHPEWNLVLAGNGEIEKGKELAINLGITEQVQFTGWISGPEKEMLFQHASVFCLPSYAEGFPMAVIDAISYGIPVVTTPVGGLPDLFSDNEHLLFFRPGNLKELALKLHTMILYPGMRHKFSESAIRVMKDNFDVEITSRQLSSLYNSLIKPNYAFYT